MTVKVTPSKATTEVEIDFALDRTTLKEATFLLQKTLILHALDAAKGNKAYASRLLGMNRTTLVMMLKRIKKIDGEAN